MSLYDLVTHLRNEADFNRSWTDGRRRSEDDISPAYRARRLEVAAEREAWADEIERCIAIHAASAGVLRALERYGFPVSEAASAAAMSIEARDLHNAARRFQTALTAERARADAAEKERDQWCAIAARTEEAAAKWEMKAQAAESTLAETKAALERAREGLDEADGCFEAALAEGWIDALANGDIERIRDLWQRRIAFARAALTTGGE